MTQHWKLFFDESGSFFDHRYPRDRVRDVAIGGVLLRAVDDADRQKRWNGLLTQVAPWLQPPLHAADIRYMSPHVVTLYAPGKRAKKSQRLFKRSLGSLAEPSLAAAERGYAQLRRHARQALEKSQERLRSQKTLGFSQVRDLDVVLSSELAAPDLALLRDLTHAVVGRYYDALRDALAGHTTVLVAASESERRDAIPDPPTSGDHYLNLVVALLDRVVDVLSGRDGEHVVELHPLGRHVWDPGFGAMLPLHCNLLTALLDARSPRAPHSRVRLTCGKVHRYIAPLDPALVIADGIANVSGGAVRSGKQPYPQLEARFERWLGARPRTADGLPTLAATGAASTFIEAARASAPDIEAQWQALNEGPAKRWACDQAQAWGEALGDERYHWRRP